MSKTRRAKSSKLTGMTFNELVMEIGRLHYAEDIADLVLKLVESAPKESV